MKILSLKYSLSQWLVWVYFLYFCVMFAAEKNYLAAVVTGFAFVHAFTSDVLLENYKLLVDKFRYALEEQSLWIIDMQRKMKGVMNDNQTEQTDSTPH